MADVLERLKAALSNRYRIERELGSGGMATVYLALDLKHERRVAVKVLRPELATSLGPDRFLREIKITANLNHPHILPLLDSGEADSFLYYVMPYLEGESLRDRLRREKQLPTEDALKITAEIADALDYAHSRNVVHRDVKPENILLEAGHAVVADFGIAKAVSAAGGQSLTETGMAIGTPAYMSPEQASGEQDLDGRSDQYSLGCVMYEMLGGEPPYTGITPQAIISKKLSEPTPRISVVREAVPPVVEDALLKALAKTPADRFATAHDMAVALTSVGMVTPETGVVAASAGKRGPTGMVYAAASIGVIALAVVVWMILIGRGTSSDLIDNLVVVAPFENRTGDPSLDFIGDLAADWITGGLTDLPAVQVLPPQDALQMQARQRSDSAHVDAPPSAQELGLATKASLVITGAYYHAANNLEFQSQVVDVAAGGALAFSAQPVRGGRDEPQHALMELQEQLMGSVALHLDVVDASWGEDFVNSRRPPSISAYRAYAEARAAMRRVDLQESMRLHRRAIELDSTFVAAYMSLVSGPLFNLGQWAEIDSVMMLAKRAVPNASRLERLQLQYGEALASGNLSRVLAVLREALEIAPNPALSGTAGMHAVEFNHPQLAVEIIPSQEGWQEWFPWWYFLTTARHMLGDHRRELEDARRWLELMPRNDARFARVRASVALGDTGAVKDVLRDISGGGSVPHILLIVAEEMRVHGYPELATQVERRVVDWYDGDPGQAVSGPRHRVQYAKALIAVGRYDDARAMIEPLITTYPDNIAYRGYLGVIAARAGNVENAREIARQLARVERPYLFGGHLAWQARIAAVLGERDEAVDLLSRGFAQGLKFHPSDWIIGFTDETFASEHNVWLHSEPEFESLRGYQPFEELVRPKG